MALDKNTGKIGELEEQIAKTKYNKKTSHAIGLMKAQLAKLKEKRESSIAKASGPGDGYHVRRSGDATIIMVGFPSTGKSTLLNALTDAKSEVAAYAFTTLTVIPGMLEYKHAKIQVLDVPGIVSGAASGRGRGREVLSVMRNADLCLFILDSQHPEHYEAIKSEVYDSHVRVNQKKPDIRIKKTTKNGIRIGKTVLMTSLNDETIRAILREFRINNADVLIRTDVTEDQFIDMVQENKKYMPAITVLNKEDLVSPDELSKLKKDLNVDIAVSGEKMTHIEELKEMIFQRLELIRLFLKEPGKPADMKVPLITFRGCTVKDLCEKLHRDFVSKFKFCRVWGKSAKFPGQKLALGHVLKDEDVIELHIR